MVLQQLIDQRMLIDIDINMTLSSESAQSNIALLESEAAAVEAGPLHPLRRSFRVFFLSVDVVYYGPS